jgi:outer membrane protein
VKSPKDVSLWLKFFQSCPLDCGGDGLLVFGVSDFYTSPSVGEKRKMKRLFNLATRADALLAGSLSVCLFLSAGAGQAETLSEAWQIAMERDLTLLSANSRVEAAEADLAAAKAQRYPILSASGTVMTMDETPAFDFGAAGIPVQLPLYEGSTVVTSDARVTVPLFTSGALSHGIAAAEGGLGSSKFQALSVAMDTRLSVADAYIGVLRADSNLQIADSNLRSLTAHAADVKDMFSAGLVPRNDHLSAQVALADAQQRQLQATNHLDLARAAYNRGLDRPLDTQVILENKTPVVQIDFPAADLEALTAMALERRPELGGMDEGAVALRAQADATKARGLPQVALTGGYTYMENQFLNQEDYWMVGVGVRWELFDSGRTRHAADALSRRARALSQNRRNMEGVVALQVRQSWLDLSESRQRLKVVARSVEQSEENLKVVRDRYRNGEGTNTDVLGAQALSNLSKQNYDNARYDIELSRIRLARAVGLL